jgi:hypothetical protein
MENKRVTISMPCFGRPQRTVRSIECIMKQNTNGWEALVTGDGCDFMKDFVVSDYCQDLIKEADKNGNSLVVSNNIQNMGGHGYFITNYHILIAKGKYFCFFANDDIITENHLKNYLSGIENTDYDFVYFDSFVYPTQTKRVSQLQYGMIGHSELIVKTEFLKQMQKHTPDYGHDWYLIQEMINKGMFKKHNIVGEPTYMVMSLPNNREQGID